MVAFGLVHGAWHDGWCWEGVRGELEQRGHTVVAPDMPIDQRGLGLADYADAVEEAMPADGGLVLVGHSLGASVIPLVAARRRVRRLVFVCPALRQPGRTLAEQAEEDADMTTWDLMTGRTIYDDESSAWTDADAAIAAIYQDCDPGLARDYVERSDRDSDQRAEGFKVMLAALPYSRQETFEFLDIGTGQGAAPWIAVSSDERSYRRRTSSGSLSIRDIIVGTSTLCVTR